MRLETKEEHDLVVVKSFPTMAHIFLNIQFKVENIKWKTVYIRVVIVYFIFSLVNVELWSKELTLHIEHNKWQDEVNSNPKSVNGTWMER